MEKRINRLVNKSFEKRLLDSPVPNRKIKFLPSGNKSKSKIIKPFNSEIIKLLPDPLKPTKYVPPKPTPKPRVLSKRPIPLLRPRPSPKPIDKKVKKLIDEITPYYKPEAIEEFNKILKGKKFLRVKITEKRQALKKRVKSFEVAIIKRKDPTKQLYYTTPDVA